MQKLRFITNTHLLKRMVWFVFAGVVLALIAFGVTYYLDRYVHVGDQSPILKNIDHLEKMVRENPQNVETRLSLAQYYLENSMFADAITQAQQVTKAYPDNDGALLILGVAYTQSGQKELAIKPLEKFVTMHAKAEMAHVDSELEAALYFLGENFNKLNQAEKAVTVLTQALTISHTDADAMFQLGIAYALLGQHQLAIDNFQKAVLFVPGFGEAYSRMADSYSALAKPDYVVYARGMEAYTRQNYREASRLLNQSAEKLPDFLLLHIGLGLTYEQLGDFLHARQSFERALEIEPTNFTAGNALVRVKLRTDNKK
jgi:tetratricopeptide (TPR) repeat protein